MSEMVDEVLRKGQGALLGKMDIKQTYRNIPVAAQDSQLLGMQWEGKLYVDRVLPFGLPNYFLGGGRRIRVDNGSERCFMGETLP